jgi:hypothetical protein
VLVVGCSPKPEICRPLAAQRILVLCGWNSLGKEVRRNLARKPPPGAAVAQEEVEKINGSEDAPKL